MKKIIITKKNNLEEEINSGAMKRMAGVSKKLSNAENIHMAVANIPKDRCSTTHFHTNCESAIYVLSGKGIFLHGDNLELEEEISEGDFIFVPDGALHQPVNTGKDDLKLIVARNTPVEIVKESPDLGRKDC
ncbi:MAG: cupin domain-containing protein [Dehalococcoidia bacterium]|nr:MAG: cupin domain-containing protein [Chloroflexota bacterium]|tara:strand:+ start:4603 stop:4998 length:396 start_codon:yes stop_codon:yes gene_type:complete